MTTLTSLHTASILSNNLDIKINDSIKNYREIIVALHSAGDNTIGAGIELIRIPTQFVTYKTNEFTGVHYHFGLVPYVSEYQIGFKDNNTFTALYVDNKSEYQLCATIYGYQKI